MLYSLLILLHLLLSVSASPFLTPDPQIVVSSSESINSPFPPSPALQKPLEAPRPDRTPYYDPRPGGGSLLNVRFSLSVPLQIELRNADKKNVLFIYSETLGEEVSH